MQYQQLRNLQKGEKNYNNDGIDIWTYIDFILICENISSVIIKSQLL